MAALTTAGLLSSLAGRPGSADHFRRALEITEREPRAAGDHSPRVAFAHERWWRGQFAEAAQLLERERGIAEEHGDEGFLIRLNVFGAVLATYRGQWDEAAQLLEAALLDATGYWRMLALLHRGILRGRRGDRRALEDAREVGATSIAGSDPVFAAGAAFASRADRPCFGRYRVGGRADGGPAGDERSGAARAGRITQCSSPRRSVSSSRPTVSTGPRRSSSSWNAGTSSWSRGERPRRNSAAGSWPWARTTCRRPTDNSQPPGKGSRPWARPGSSARRCSPKVDSCAGWAAVARPPSASSRAVRVFTDLGAEPASRRAADELHGARPRPRRDDSLTMAETRVAALVAAGRTNREVAAGLFTTVATVEAHLTRIYAKLRIRSRTELARLVSEGSVEVPPAVADVGID